MGKDINTGICSYRGAFFDEESVKLYKLLQRVSLCNNRLLDLAMDILAVINEAPIKYEARYQNNIFRLFAKTQNTSLEQVKIIFRFLFEQELIELQEEKMALTSYGKLFLMSDRISSSVDMIRYFWENADWVEIFQGSPSKFLHRDSRRYTACLLSQIEVRNSSEEEIMIKSQCIEDIFYGSLSAIDEILNDEGMLFIILNILAPLGLVKIKCDAENREIVPTDSGRGIFEYYSKDMFKEYADLIEESWECYDRGNFQQAHEMAVNVIRVCGSMLEAYNIIGCVYIKQKDYERAMSIFLHAIQICEKKMADIDGSRDTVMESYISMYYNLGLCYFYMANNIRALQIFLSIRKTIPYTLDSLESIIDTIKKMIII
jgi:tetratricopeptide (TPR) repeat protein